MSTYIKSVQPIIQNAKIEDAAKIIEFQISMALETENLMLDRTILQSGVEAVFKDSNKGRYLVIQDENKTVGSCLLINEWSDWRNGFVWWIHSVYIEKSYRGRGFFSQLYEFIKNEAIEQNVRGLRLYVDKRNHHAQKVYEKLGMNKNHYELFEWLNK